MLSKISSTIQAAADLVAPPCARVEDLQYHWQQVLQECHRCQLTKGRNIIVVEETKAPRHLQEIIKIVADDYNESKCNLTDPPTIYSLSPCLEFIIQERLLVSLASFAWSEKPLGIRQFVFIFLTKVLKYLHHSFLHQMRIHKPLQAMVKATCDKRASPYENQEIDFLEIVCEKIREDSSLILLHMEPITMSGDASGYTPVMSGISTPSQRLSISEDSLPEEDNVKIERSSNCGDSCINKVDLSGTRTFSRSPSVPYHSTTFSKFPLIEAIINLCHSNDSSISVRAHQCLLSITSLKEPRSSEAIGSHTLLAHYIASRLTTIAEEIPLTTETSIIEEANTGEDSKKETIHNSHGDSDEDDSYLHSDPDLSTLDYQGRKEFLEFLNWLSFFDNLVNTCENILSLTICGVIRELFFDGFLRANFISEDDDIAALYNAILAKMVLNVNALSLANCLISWILEDDDYESSESMREVLFRRCRTAPHHLQMHSLRLLQVLVEKPGCLALNLLALPYLSSRCYFDSSTAEHQQNSWSDEEDERYKNRGDLAPGSIPVSRTLAPSNINRIVKGFLSLIPEDIRSTSDDDFESYKADAMRQYREVCRHLSLTSWPREALTGESSDDASSTSRESRAEAEVNSFNEGAFLRLMLDLMEALPEQDYDINLQVTSLISSLALLPHPHIHEFILNPTLPMVDGVRTPHEILSSVVKKLHPTIVSKKDFRTYLKVTRFQLLGTIDRMDYERDIDDSKFEALVVLEEFSKELAAIAYAKYVCEGNL